MKWLVLIFVFLCSCEVSEPEILGHPAVGYVSEDAGDVETDAPTGLRWVCTCELPLEAHPTREVSVCDNTDLDYNGIAIEATEGCGFWLDEWYPGLGECLCPASECLLVGEC